VRMRTLTGNNRGFTLVEMMFAVFSGLLLMAAILVAVQSGLRSSTSMERKVSAQQDVGAAVDLMVLEIGMASYNPTFSTNANFWTDNTCANSTTQNYRGIQEATANSITVEMDLDASTQIADGNNEVIRYVYDTTNQYITRTTNCTSGAQPFLGETNANAALGRPKGVNVTNAALGLSVFRYYDGAGAEITIGAGSNQLPASIPNIRRIDITIAAETEKVNDVTHQKGNMIYSTSVIPRNHAIN